ncbi:hypothetical protein [Variovorax saccharolyticus]|uniref:hypothetical protein n=1 Tax=Variovorax saccharolyticus TaxID=3053516 RepID=UPI0025777A30|nr:hypothetical protein [Variovorax sp. J22R187]MDM0018382.1 hypothetical protein [Variovorax sp. J22R187]
MTDIEKHSRHAAHARRLIAAVQAASATKRTDADAMSIIDGLRALLWLDGGIRRAASTTLIDALIAEHGVAVVLHAAIEACASRPAGLAAWMRHACRQHSSQINQPIINGEMQ